MKTKYVALALMIVTLVSCNEKLPEGKDVPITVSANVESMITRAGYGATESGTSVLPETFYLNIKQEEGTSQYNYSNVQMTKGENNKYVAGQTLLWKDATRNPSVSAYTTTSTAVSVSSDQSTAAKVTENDLLGAVSSTSGDITVTGDNISIRFRHLLCKLDVTYSFGSSLSGAGVRCTITSVSYQGFCTSATLNCDAGTVAQGNETGNISSYVDGLKSEAIFVPCSSTNAKLLVSVNVTTGEGSSATTSQRDFSVSLPSNVTFTSGNRYTMNVKLGGDSAGIGEISVAGWTEGDLGENANLMAE